MGKIERKLITCHLNVENYHAARNVLDRIPTNRKNQRLTRYLAYCVALRLNDNNQVQAALNNIASGPDEGNELLFACVSETVKHGNKRQGARLLQRMLDKYNYNPPPEVDTCAMLRCTARLLTSILDEEDARDEEVIARLCGIFKAGMPCVSVVLKSNADVDSCTTV